MEAVDFRAEGDMNRGVLTGDNVRAKEDCDCLLGSVGAVFLGDKRAAADLDTSGSFLNWCCSGKTLMTEYTGTVTVLDVTDVVEEGEGLMLA